MQNLWLGTNELTITDAAGSVKTASAPMQTYVLWEQSVGHTRNKYKISKDSHREGWDNYSYSRNRLIPNEEGSIRYNFTIDREHPKKMKIGLVTTDSSLQQEMSGHFLLIEGLSVKVLDDHTIISNKPLHQNQHTLEIQRVNHAIRYFLDDVMLNEIPCDMTRELILMASIHSVEGDIEAVTASFANYPALVVNTSTFAENISCRFSGHNVKQEFTAGKKEEVLLERIAVGTTSQYHLLLFEERGEVLHALLHLNDSYKITQVKLIAEVNGQAETTPLSPAFFKTIADPHCTHCQSPTSQC